MTYNNGDDRDRSLLNQEASHEDRRRDGENPLESNYYYYQGSVPKQRRKANGKHYFSLRTILIPLVFLFVHFGLQTAASTGVAVFKLASGILGGQSFDPQVLQEVLYSEQTLILLISGSISILVFGIALHVFNKKHKNYVLTSKPSGQELLASVGMTLGMIGGTSLIVLAMQLMSKVSDFWARHLDFYVELTQVFTDESSVLLQILAIVVIIPIAEELLFRAIVCGELMRVFPSWAVILISGVFFAVIHMNVVQSTYVLLAGIALSAIYVWSRSLTLTIIMHALYNFLGSTVPMLFSENDTLMLWITNIELIFVPIAILIAIWFYMKQKQLAPVEV